MAGSVSSVAVVAMAMVGAAAWPAGASRCRAPLPVAVHPDITFHNVEFWRFTGSKLTAHGTAREVIYDRSFGRARGAAVDVTFPPRHPGDRLARVQAARAVGDNASKLIDGDRGVVITREDGTATTESAQYDGAADRVAGDTPVELVTPRFVVHGIGFITDAHTEQTEIDGPVKGREVVHP